MSDRPGDPPPEPTPQTADAAHAEPAAPEPAPAGPRKEGRFRVPHTLVLLFAMIVLAYVAPLADLVGVTRQVAVLAYQFGDGFTNILVPTNAVLIGILAIAGVPYERWVRFVLPFMVKVWVLGSIALAVAVWIGYS